MLNPALPSYSDPGLWALASASSSASSARHSPSRSRPAWTTHSHAAETRESRAGPLPGSSSEARSCQRPSICQDVRLAPKRRAAKEFWLTHSWLALASSDWPLLVGSGDTVRKLCLERGVGRGCAYFAQQFVPNQASLMHGPRSGRSFQRDILTFGNQCRSQSPSDQRDIEGVRSLLPISSLSPLGLCHGDPSQCSPVSAARRDRVAPREKPGSTSPRGSRGIPQSRRWTAMLGGGRICLRRLLLQDSLQRRWS